MGVTLSDPVIAFQFSKNRVFGGKDISLGETLSGDDIVHFKWYENGCFD